MTAKYIPLFYLIAASLLWLPFAKAETETFLELEKLNVSLDAQGSSIEQAFEPLPGKTLDLLEGSGGCSLQAMVTHGQNLSLILGWMALLGLPILTQIRSRKKNKKVSRFVS